MHSRDRWGDVRRFGAHGKVRGHGSQHCSWGTGLRRSEAALLLRAGRADAAARGGRQLGAGGAFRDVLCLLQRSPEWTSDAIGLPGSDRPETAPRLPRTRLLRGRLRRAADDGTEPASGGATLRSYRWEARTRASIPGDNQSARVRIRAVRYLRRGTAAVGRDQHDPRERPPRLRRPRGGATATDRPAPGCRAGPSSCRWLRRGSRRRRAARRHG